jgi:K(+)-stimulated pyrophosphate-energized sodium pump
MKIVFNIKEDDARNPGVIADCRGTRRLDQPIRRLRTYGVTGVALSLHPAGGLRPDCQVKLLVWIFMMRV